MVIGANDLERMNESLDYFFFKKLRIKKVEEVQQIGSVGKRACCQAC